MSNLKTFKMRVSEVNTLGFDQFFDIFSNVVERCPLVACALWMVRPYRDAEQLIDAMKGFLDCLPQKGKIQTWKSFFTQFLWW